MLIYRLLRYLTCNGGFAESEIDLLSKYLKNVCLNLTLNVDYDVKNYENKKIITFTSVKTIIFKSSILAISIIYLILTIKP